MSEDVHKDSIGREWIHKRTYSVGPDCSKCGRSEVYDNIPKLSEMEKGWTSYIVKGPAKVGMPDGTAVEKEAEWLERYCPDCKPTRASDPQRPTPLPGWKRGFIQQEVKDEEVERGD